MASHTHTFPDLVPPPQGITCVMGFVDVGTRQLLGAKLDFFRGTRQKVNQKHCGPND